MIKEGIDVVKKNGFYYIYKNGRKIKYKPWLGDIFSFMYDYIMTKSIFPKKFEASIEKHTGFLIKELSTIHNNSVLEIATGSGNLAGILNNDNSYVGIDISAGLLRIASRRFRNAGFKNPELYLSNAEQLPFSDNLFDISICNLSLNFFDDLDSIIKELKRVLKKQGIFICSVPIPERNKKQSVIRGKLYSEHELKELFSKHKFRFDPYDFENGTLLYFKAIFMDK